MAALWWPGNQLCERRRGWLPCGGLGASCVLAWFWTVESSAHAQVFIIVCLLLPTDDRDVPPGLGM